MIIWGNINFEGPFSALNFIPPEKPAIFVIMTEPDPKNKPHMYKSIYFGESENLNEKEFWKFHDKYECFIEDAKSESNLYIGFYDVSKFKEEHRKHIILKLIEKYNPICNKKITPRWVEVAPTQIYV